MTDAELKTWTDEHPQAVPYLDFYAGKAVQTSRRNRPQGEELGPRLDALEARILAKDTELAAERLRHLGVERALEAGIAPELLEGFTFGNADEVQKKIDLIAAQAESVRLRTTRELMAQGHKPGGGPGYSTPAGPRSVEDFIVEAARRQGAPHRATMDEN